MKELIAQVEQGIDICTRLRCWHSEYKLRQALIKLKEYYFLTNPTKERGKNATKTNMEWQVSNRIKT